MQKISRTFVYEMVRRCRLGHYPSCREILKRLGPPRWFSSGRLAVMCYGEFDDRWVSRFGPNIWIFFTHRGRVRLLGGNPLESQRRQMAAYGVRLIDGRTHRLVRSRPLPRNFPFERPRQGSCSGKGKRA